jgi:hypothetical protein
MYKQIGNFKVRCVEAHKGNSAIHTTDKIYNIKNGKMICDDGVQRPIFDSFQSLDDLQKWSSSKFVLVTEPTFTKADLRTGMWLEKRTKERAVILLDTRDGDVYSGETWGYLENYREDLTSKYSAEYDIVTIYQPTFNSAYHKFDLSKAELLYQRIEPPKMTHKEIETELGHEFEYVKE